MILIKKALTICKGFFMLKHFEKADIDINANPPTNILAERWGIRVYAISLLLKVRSILVNQINHRSHIHRT